MIQVVMQQIPRPIILCFNYVVCMDATAWTTDRQFYICSVHHLNCPYIQTYTIVLGAAAANSFDV